MGLKEDALKDIEGARTGIPEGMLHRAQARALLHLADKIEELIAVVSFAARLKTAQHLAEAKAPADTSWLKSTE